MPPADGLEGITSNETAESNRVNRTLPKKLDVISFQFRYGFMRKRGKNRNLGINFLVTTRNWEEQNSKKNKKGREVSIAKKKGVKNSKNFSDTSSPSTLFGHTTHTSH